MVMLHVHLLEHQDIEGVYSLACNESLSRWEVNYNNGSYYSICTSDIDYFNVPSCDMSDWYALDAYGGIYWSVTCEESTNLGVDINIRRR